MTEPRSEPWLEPMETPPSRRDLLRRLGGAALALGAGGWGCLRGSARRLRVDGAAASVFRRHGVDGCLVLYDLARDRTTLVNPALADRPFRPASTFKIPNTLIGLETGVVPDDHFSLKWNGVRSRFVEAWNRDHDLASAMKHSVLWFFQEIARRVGAERYRRYLARFDYGNRDIGGGIDRFWLDGALRITPRQQVGFLIRLVRGELPIRPRNATILRRILLRADAGGVTLRAKTGLTEQGRYKVGWLVGLVERRGAAAGGDGARGGPPRPSHVFACLVLGPRARPWRQSQVFRARREVPVALLRHLGVVPPEMGLPR